MDFPLAKGIHRFFSLWLTLVAMDGFSSDVVLAEVPDHFVRAIFSPGEDQRCFNFGSVQNLHEQIALCALAHKQHALVHGFCRV